MKIEMHVDHLQELAGDRGGELLGIVAAGVARELAVEVELVDRGETAVLRIGARVGDRQEQQAALDRGILQYPVELEDDLRAGGLVAVDGAADADRRALAAAGNLMNGERGLRSIRMGRETRPENSGGIR